ncbi:Rho-GTPase-activating protein 8 [Kickxella alabastrina]|uniref:Rho-GTPase-activating protein 8 n=1 Tax=Kickxella alabastrina TaxID=61397 RepID=A0ACC1I341_9FUNG|nr:Rho-GTPase-activating protein 8 [Kickxella alabastrina]
MLQRMQKEVPQHDVKFGILGTFRGLISGESLAGWWCTNYPTVVRNEADAVSVGQSMMDQGYLRFMGRGSQFQSRANGYYQWKKPALDFQSDDDYDSDDDQPLSNRTSTNLGRAAMSYERAQREADEASQVYRDSVVRAELVRTDLEEQLINYLDTMEVWELNRLINVKTMLAEYARIHKMPVQAELAIGDRLEVYEESLKPQQDIQWTIEHYGTGRFTPRPIIFRPFGLSPAEYQIFGVSLDEQLLVSHKDIPLFPAKALSVIRKATLDMAPEDRYKVWTTRALLRNIHEMRNSVNRGSKVTLKQLQQFELPVVANVLVLYFLELPMPLCPEELHGPLRALYSSASEKSTEDTLDTIRGLLKGVSYAHLKTLQTLFFTLSEQVKDDTDVEARKAFIRDISMRLGPVILRGREIVGVSVSRVPQIFATDLIEHYDELLGGIDVQRPVKLSVRPNKGDIAYEGSQLAHDMDQAHLTSGASANATAVASSRLQLAVTPNTSDTVKTHPSFDDDEMLIDNILEETDGAAAGEDNMDFFLKDEDSDGTDDEDGDNEDDDAVDGGKNI